MKNLEGPDWSLSSQRRQVDLLGTIALAPAYVTAIAAGATAIRLIDDMSPIFTQTRYGRELKPFTMYKLRTMPESTPETPSQNGAADSRATQLGSFLRHRRLDEAPQAINLFRGDMSLVGPRPLIRQDVEDTLDILSPQEQAQWVQSRTTAKPGLTSPQTILYSGKLSAIDHAEHLYGRALGDIEYASTASFAQDVRVIIDSCGLTLSGLIQSESNKPGYRKSARLFDAVATSMGVELKPEEKQYWRTMLGAARALDDIVDSGVEVDSIAEPLDHMTKGEPASTMNEAEAKQFATILDQQTPERREAILAAFTQLPEYAKRRREARTCKQLILVNNEEAACFATLLKLPVGGDDSSNRQRFNAWLDDFAEAGYTLDTAADLQDDADNNLIGVTPSTAHRLAIALHALPSVYRTTRQTPPRILLGMAQVAMDYIAPR